MPPVPGLEAGVVEAVLFAPGFCFAAETAAANVPTNPWFPAVMLKPSDESDPWGTPEVSPDRITEVGLSIACTLPTATDAPTPVLPTATEFPPPK